MAYHRAIVESYEGLITLHMPEPGRGEVEWIVQAGQEDEAALLSAKLAQEIVLIPIERPTDWPG